MIDTRVATSTTPVEIVLFLVPSAKEIFSHEKGGKQRYDGIETSRRGCDISNHHQCE
jgi:hypothetical protein